MSKKLGGFHGKKHTRVARLKEKREAAETLKAVRAKRTAAQQLAVLDKRLGRGVGAQKERRRLQAERR